MSGKDKLGLAQELSSVQGVIDVEVDANRLTIVTEVEDGANGRREVPPGVASRVQSVLEGTDFVSEGGGVTDGEFHPNAPGYSQSEVMKKNFVEAIR